ncbi:DNA repair protein RadC [Pseudoalteromonas sp. L1]|uniref:RadC family protein n=1 Tax=Pseudoalteromonas sp. L1 TaxID=195716 RepID=UPI001F00A301|nr:DNA repair protein RadC [Pseudoalteromonas sp. L1]
MPNVQSRKYITEHPMTAEQVLEKAAEVLHKKYLVGKALTSSQSTKDFLQFKLGQYEREVFAILILNSQHKLIEYKELFFGTINSASVYPREVVKEVLHLNGAAVIFAHNHPSGESEPSQSDVKLTNRLKESLALIDVQVLDHIVVGSNASSFAERGLL